MTGGGWGCRAPVPGLLLPNGIICKINASGKLSYLRPNWAGGGRWDLPYSKRRPPRHRLDCPIAKKNFLNAAAQREIGDSGVVLRCAVLHLHAYSMPLLLFIRSWYMRHMRHACPMIPPLGRDWASPIAVGC